MKLPKTMEVENQECCLSGLFPFPDFHLRPEPILWIEFSVPT